MNQAVVRSGMMFAAVPPSRMIPWTRAVGRSCWRHRPTELKSRIIASSALRPIHGSDDACAWRPWNTTSTSSEASGQLSTWLRSQGWYISAASRPAISPSSIMICLPLPRSSAGVPRNTISPGSSSAIEARAIAAPTPDAAMVLWPQPCPSPGSASYSARIPIRGPSPPRPPRRTARIAVASVPAGSSTSKPCRTSTSATAAAARCSSKAVSGSAWIRCDRSRISARAASTAAAMRAFWSAWGSAGVVAVSDGNGQAPTARGRHGPGETERSARGCWFRHRSAESVDSATSARMIMNSAIGHSSTPCSRSTTSTVTMRPTHAARRTARVQSPW